MTDDTEAISADSPWLRLLRRAFRIPDLVNQSNAAAAIALAVLPPPVTNSVPPRPEQLVTARRMIAKFVALGDAGRLDRYLLAIGQPHTNSFIGWDDDAREELKRDLFSSLALRPDAYAAPMIERFISIVIGHAVAHPFYAEDGPPPAELEQQET